MPYSDKRVKIDASTKEIEALTAAARRWGLCDEDEVLVPSFGDAYKNRHNDKRRTVHFKVMSLDVWELESS